MSFDKHKINRFYQLPIVDDSAYQQLVAALDYDAIIKCLTKNRIFWKKNNKNELVNFQTKHLTIVCRIWHHFATLKISLKSHKRKVDTKICDLARHQI